MGVGYKSAELRWERAAVTEISTTYKPVNSYEQKIGYSCPIGQVPSTHHDIHNFKNEWQCVQCYPYPWYLGLDFEALEAKKEKLVSLESMTGYLWHSDLKYIICISDVHLPFAFSIMKGRIHTLSNNLNCYLFVILKDVFVRGAGWKCFPIVFRWVVSTAYNAASGYHFWSVMK